MFEARNTIAAARAGIPSPKRQQVTCASCRGLCDAEDTCTTAADLEQCGFTTAQAEAAHRAFPVICIDCTRQVTFCEGCGDAMREACAWAWVRINGEDRAVCS